MADAQLLELDVGAVAHGGHCVARDDTGRVVFVRHALPGERVRAAVTEANRSFLRADAVEVLRPSPDRVIAPCPHAGPGRCGGCDWQHASAVAQRELKAAVVREQFQHLAGLETAVTVEELPGGLLGWRTRAVYAVGDVTIGDVVGLRRHRSHEIEPIDRCPLGVAGVSDSDVLRRAWPGLTGIEVARGDDGESALIGHRPGPGHRGRGRRPPDRLELLGGPPHLMHRAAGREFRVSAEGFWQVHPHAADAFAAAILAAAQPRPGECVVDLYAGAGLLTAPLAEAVGPAGQVVGVESSRQAVDDATGNLTDLPWASMTRGRITADLIRALEVEPDVVVLDPPRSGAGRDVIAAVLEAAPRVVAYLGCDPAALARDVRTALDQGWRLASLRAFDAFPMTHHVECVASLVPPELDRVANTTD